jgi:hypothetical protein
MVYMMCECDICTPTNPWHHIYIHDHMVGDHVGDINPLMCLNKLPSEKTSYKLYIVELIHAYILTRCSFYNIIRVPGWCTLH